METPKQPLAGLKVLVTRPEELADNLATLIEQAGGSPVLYPVISIEEPKNTESRSNSLKQLSSFDIAIFISPTAVQKTLAHIDCLPSTLKVAAIGSSTANSLSKNNVLVSIKPDGHDSESLLKHVELQPDKIAGKSIVIFRGEGGRENLAMSSGLEAVMYITRRCIAACAKKTCHRYLLSNLVSLIFLQSLATKDYRIFLI